MTNAKTSKRCTPLLAVLLVGALSSTANAQTVSSRSFVAEQFQPEGGFYDILGLQGAQTAPHLRWGIWAYVNESHQIIRLVKNDNSQAVNLLKNQLMLDIGGTLGLWDRVEIGLALPVAIYQDGETAAFIDSGLATDIKGAGVGDLRLTPKVNFWKGTNFNMGVAVPIAFPTGPTNTYLSYGTVSLTPELLLEYDTDGGLRLLGNAGWSIRPTRDFVTSKEQSALTYGLGIEIPVAEDWKVLGSLFGSWIPDAAQTDPNQIPSVSVPLEIQPAVDWQATTDWGFLLGAGVGLTQGFGAPQWRVFIGAHVRPTSAPPPDTDHDDIVDPNDVCPTVHKGAHPDSDPNRLGCPEPDTDGDGVFDSQDKCKDQPPGQNPDPNRLGCPEPDTDGDGIVDSKDACPTVAAGPNPDPNKPGCPEPDTDGDGITDSKDACDKVPAGPNPDPAHAGCPMPDRDGDQVLDSQDACPDVPGAPSRDPKKNGCPGLVKMRGAEIVTLRPIQFAVGTAKILPASFPILQGVLEVLYTHPEMSLVAIEGHTDNKGVAKKNLTLSQQRADACKAWLVKAGIPPTRLQAKGFGAEKPIADNNTADGRSQNRRVEFKSVSQPESAAQDPATTVAPAPPPAPAAPEPAAPAPAPAAKPAKGKKAKK